VTIRGTARDLPEHRKEAMDRCPRPTTTVPSTNRRAWWMRRRFFEKESIELERMESRDVIRKLKADGWYEVKPSGQQFEHPTKKDRATAPHRKGITRLGLSRASRYRPGSNWN